MMTAEQVALIGQTVHTDSGEDHVVPGVVTGWRDGLPVVKMNRDPSIASRVGGKVSVVCHWYSGGGLDLETGLPPFEREDGGVQCWIPDIDESGNLFASVPDTGVVAHEPEPEQPVDDDLGEPDADGSGEDGGGGSGEVETGLLDEDDSDGAGFDEEPDEDLEDDDADK